jgi:GNAT superfamily N-acetyltransferase
MDITVRPLEAHEWEPYKVLRITALTESPDAFGASVEEARARTDADWQALARSFTGPDRRLFIAVRGDKPVGLGSAVKDDEGVGHIGAMWVAPEVRGTGAGRRVFDAICDWLVTQGCHTLALWVTDGNARAEALYSRNGFTRTGVIKPLRDGSPLRNVEMRRRVSD